MQETIQLTEDEIKFIKSFRDLLDKHKLSLANLRQQYLSSEKKLLEAMEKADADFMNAMRLLAQNKKVDDSWFFDLERYCFFKKEV